MLYMYYTSAKCLRKITSKSVLCENLIHVKSYALGTKGKLRQGGWGKEHHWALTVYTIHYTRNILYISCIHNQPQYEKTELGDKRPHGYQVIRQRKTQSSHTVNVHSLWHPELQAMSKFDPPARQSPEIVQPYQKIAWQTRVIGRKLLRATSNLLPTSALCQKTVKNNLKVIINKT